MIYIITFSVSIFFAILYKYSGIQYTLNSKQRSKRRIINGKYQITASSIKKNIYLLLLSLPLIMLSGLRYGISVDFLQVYEKNFQKILYNGIIDSEFEIGFTLLVKLCSIIVNQSWFMFLTVSAITIVLFIKAIQDNSKNFLLSFLLFLSMGIYFDTYNGIRQYLAVSIFLYSIRYIKERKFIKYIITILIAALIHTSVLVTIPFYWIGNMNINSKKWIILNFIFLLLSRYISQGYIYLLSISERYSVYVDRNLLVNYTNFSTSGLVMAILALIPCLLSENKMKKSFEGRFLFNNMMIGVVIVILSGSIPLVERVLYYFKSVFILTIPFGISCLDNKYNKSVFAFSEIFLLSSMTIIGMLVNGWYAVLPYQSIFTK